MSQLHCIIVFDQLEFILYVGWGLTFLTASLVFSILDKGILHTAAAAREQVSSEISISIQQSSDSGLFTFYIELKIR